jgi:acetyl-CoA decarbonylase/synthase, CODH/ACS complex subunit delta
MDYRAPVETYNGKVKEVIIGKGDKAVKIGGENILPLHYFEGKTENPPKIALEVNDVKPENWAEWEYEPFTDVINDPVKWAKKCLEYGADLICLKLKGSDPAGQNLPVEKSVELVKQVIAGTSHTPLIIYGSGDEVKDTQLLTAISGACPGERLLLGPLTKENYEPICKVAIEYGHNIIAQTPVDINLEKELNVKIMKTMPPERIVIDPMTSALGYGMEYSFTIMERTKQIGIVFCDVTMQMPLIADLGSECAKTKQSKENKDQGLLWESTTAVSMVLAGANLLVLRHPETVAVVRDVIQGKI